MFISSKDKPSLYPVLYQLYPRTTCSQYRAVVMLQAADGLRAWAEGECPQSTQAQIAFTVRWERTSQALMFQSEECRKLAIMGTPSKHSKPGRACGHCIKVGNNAKKLRMAMSCVFNYIDAPTIMETRYLLPEAVPELREAISNREYITVEELRDPSVCNLEVLQEFFEGDFDTVFQKVLVVTSWIHSRTIQEYSRSCNIISNSPKRHRRIQAYQFTGLRMGTRFQVVDNSNLSMQYCYSVLQGASQGGFDDSK